MATTDYPLTADEGPDDLPRTLRRAREEREQAQRQASGDLGSDSKTSLHGPTAAIGSSGLAVEPDLTSNSGSNETTVTRLEIPFGHLVGFFLKAVIAAIPALILLLAILWGFGQLLETLFPELIKMKIQIYFPH